MKPADALKRTLHMAEQMRALKSKAVFVGLPAEEVGGKVYGDGNTIISVGAGHEYGVDGLPQRSFLRTPFRVKRTELNAGIAAQFEGATSGTISADAALGRIGALATNISKGAFTSLGYGEWQPIAAETAAAKGSTQTLIDTGILRGSITWAIRG